MAQWSIAYRNAGPSGLALQVPYVIAVEDRAASDGQADLGICAGRVMTYDRLLQRVRGARSSGDSRRVRTAAKQLRRKLGDDVNNPAYILNELQRRSR